MADRPWRRRDLAAGLRAVAFACLAGLFGVPAHADESAVQDWWEGVYAYRDLETTELFGVERFRLTVHPDGTRTLVTWNDNRARATQISAVLRIDGGWQPRDAYASYWIGGAWRGSIHAVPGEDGISLQLTGPAGARQQVLESPAAPFSVALHPVAGDGFHVAAMAAGASAATLLAVNPAGADGVTAMLVPMAIERLGLVEVSIPAGEFTAEEATLAGANRIWFLPGDYIVLRMDLPRLGARYTLECLRRGDDLVEPGLAACP